MPRFAAPSAYHCSSAWHPRDSTLQAMAHTALCTAWEIDTEEYAKERDTRVRRLAAEQGVVIHEMSGHSTLTRRATRPLPRRPPTNKV